VEEKKLTRIPLVTASEAGKAQNVNLPTCRSNCSLEMQCQFWSRLNLPGTASHRRWKPCLWLGIHYVRYVIKESGCLGLQL